MKKLLILFALIAGSIPLAAQEPQPFHSLARIDFADGPVVWGVAHTSKTALPWGTWWTITITLSIAADYLPVVDYDSLTRQPLWYAIGADRSILLNPPDWAHLQLLPEADEDPPGLKELARRLQGADGGIYGSRNVYLGMARTGKKQLTLYIVD